MRLRAREENPPKIALMRWLLIAFLVSVGALLAAAVGVACHIWLHHSRLRSTKIRAGGGLDLELAPNESTNEEFDVSPEV
jgi:hypothetical protein